MSDVGIAVPPLWLIEEQWLQDLLHWFVDRLDTPREKVISRRVTATTMPSLYRFSEDTSYRWSLIEALAKNYAVFEIRYQHAASHAERYDNAQLRLNLSAEPQLRDWLQRPRIDPLQAAWHQAISLHADRFDDGGAALKSFYPVVPGYTVEALAAAFASVSDWLDQALSLREIAARSFRGDSKFLDHRLELLTRLFGYRASGILPRPLLLTAFAPVDFNRLLIVENQDSFLRLVDQQPRQTALLYSGGFRASAGRLLSEHTRFAFLSGSNQQSFASRWREPDLPAAFWGDLDFAGLGILAALRQSFAALHAWEPGYAPMLRDLMSGGGHYPEQARKAAQFDPSSCGCAYADQELLPNIRETMHFIDQEGYMPVIP